MASSTDRRAARSWRRRHVFLPAMLAVTVFTAVGIKAPRLVSPDAIVYESIARQLVACSTLELHPRGPLLTGSEWRN